MERARCPVLEWRDHSGAAYEAATPWNRYQVGLAAAWRRWAMGSPVGERLTEPNRRCGVLMPQTTGGRPLVLRWQNHWVLHGDGRSVCVRCGIGPRPTGCRRLEGTPCPGLRPLKAAASLALRHGGLAQALRAAPATWQHKASVDFQAAMA